MLPPGQGMGDKSRIQLQSKDALTGEAKVLP